MSNRPEPDHGRIRVYTRQGFSRRRLMSLEPYVRRRSHELIDAMLAGGPPAEFIDALAFPLPGETVFRFIGFPDGDDETAQALVQRSQGVLVGQAIAGGADRDRREAARLLALLPRLHGDET